MLSNNDSFMDVNKNLKSAHYQELLSKLQYDNRFQSSSKAMIFMSSNINIRSKPLALKSPKLLP